MKIYLFLYPIREYFEEGIIGIAMRHFAEEGHSVKRLSDIISARYRARGYHVWWLLFSGSNKVPVMPDLRRLASHVTVDERDAFFSCGVTFADHVTHQKYPEPAFILDQLPKKIKHLVLGGFHQWDCVDKLACAAHQRGIAVMVDEDTTDHFFYRTSQLGEIPLNRPLDEHVAEFLRETRKELITDFVIESRQNKPWFSPVPQPTT